MSNNSIGLFDSGVGGLSVLREIRKSLPKESFIFFADQSHNPYGAKSEKQLQDLSYRITKFLLGHNIKLLVIACNTATCYAIDYLRSKFKTPIVGVVPAIRPAVTGTKKGKIAVMCTPATAKSSYLTSLISDYATFTSVLRLGCKNLEESIVYLEGGKITKLLDIYTDKIKKFGADVVVLGCTHFPLVRDDIEKGVGPHIKIIDSGKAVARRVKFLLAAEDDFSTKKLQDQYFTTGDPQKFSEVASALLKHKVVARKVFI